jgi:hypothetical protein
MSHHKIWVLGIVSILMLPTISPAHAESDDTPITEIRAGKVSIIRDADGNTQIQTDRIKVNSTSLRSRNTSKFRYRTRHRLDRSSVTTKQSIENFIDKAMTSRQSNNSVVLDSANTQITRIRGNNRTVIQSSTDER